MHLPQLLHKVEFEAIRISGTPNQLSLVRALHILHNLIPFAVIVGSAHAPRSQISRYKVAPTRGPGVNLTGISSRATSSAPGTISKSGMRVRTFSMTNLISIRAIVLPGQW